MAFVDECLDFPLLLPSTWVSLAVKICYVVTPVTFLGGVLELNFLWYRLGHLLYRAYSISGVFFRVSYLSSPCLGSLHIVG